MARKIIWKQLLIIGILSSFIHSCNKGQIDRVHLTTYKYVNNCKQNILLKQYRAGHLNNFNISIGDSLIQTLDLMFGDSRDIIASSDSIKIVFNNSKFLEYYPTIEANHHILELEYYDLTNLDKRKEEYKYTFTEEDYNNAVLIEE